jgi:hypothetical protein
MNEFDDLENQLRSLQPGTLPADLRQRLARPPERIQESPIRLRRVWACSGLLAAAACAVFFLWPFRNASSEPAPVSVYHQESTLIASKPLGYVEKDGRMWSLEEQQWQDEEIAFCSNSPVTVHSTRERLELVYEPISFD